MTERPQDRPLRIGVIGLGRRGLFALERWCDLPDVTAIAADRDPAARLVAAGLCEEAVDPDSLLGRSDLDAVLVAVPASERAAVGRRVLGAGKHLVLDPPLGRTVAEARTLFAAATAAGRRVIVLPTWRDDPDFRRAVAAVRSGGVGELRLLRFERWSAAAETAFDRLADDAPPLPRTAVYLFDQLVALAGRPAASVSAIRVGSEGLTATVAFCNGLVATVTLHEAATARIESGWAIDGDRGGYAGGRRWVLGADGERYDMPAEAFGPPPKPEEAVQRVLAGDEPAVAETESLRLMALLAAASRSLASGRAEAVELTDQGHPSPC